MSKLPENKCWKCNTNIGYSESELRALWELSRQKCPTEPPEDNIHICFEAFQLGGCTVKLMNECIEATSELVEPGDIEVINSTDW